MQCFYFYRFFSQMINDMVTTTPSHVSDNNACLLAVTHFLATLAPVRGNSGCVNFPFGQKYEILFMSIFCSTL